ncbi:MAG: hypothetical protein IK080_03940 [Clostridia bacterium]|nr:hypothetical protein [Clostridia bacterium]
MAVCPKCKQKLGLFDWGQNCPHCGVNMRFYNFEENFYREAKVAELSAAKVSIKIKRLKGAFIGGTLPIARLSVLLLPLLSVLIPVLHFSLTLPFTEKTYALSGLGLYQMFSDQTLSYIFSMVRDPFNGAAFSALRTVIFAEVGAAVLGLLVFLLTLLCFISIKKMSVVLCAVCALGMADSVAILILALRFCASAAGLPESVLTGSMSFGAVVTFLMFAAVFVLNLLIARKGVEIEYGEGDLERTEIAKKIKNGELRLEDLPQPIVETSETRAIEEEIRKQHEKLGNTADNNEDADPEDRTD